MTTSTAEPLSPERAIKPYMIRAWHQWCRDSKMTPYLLVQVDPRTQVPTEYVQEGRIVLDIADDAVRDLKIESDWITYQASFKGVVRDLKLHIDNIAAIYAAENSAYGMGFEVISIDEATWQAQLLHETTQVTPKKRPFLSIVK